MGECGQTDAPSSRERSAPPPWVRPADSARCRSVRSRRTICGRGSHKFQAWVKAPQPTPIGRRSASSASARPKQEGEFGGVELSFMGLNNQNLHNLLFRGFLKPWEAYTGAKISW